MVFDVKPNLKQSCRKETQKGIKIFPNSEIPLHSPFFKGGGFSFSKRGTVIPPFSKGGRGGIFG